MALGDLGRYIAEDDRYCRLQCALALWGCRDWW